jgi:hypothetical protein
LKSDCQLHNKVANQNKILSHTEYRGNAWILEYRELALIKMCVRGDVLPKPSRAAQCPQKSSSRDLAASEETCAKSTP